MKTYLALVHKDKDSAWGVSFPDIPGCFSAADRLEDVIANASEALALWFADADPVDPRDSTSIVAEVADELAAGAFLIAVPLSPRDAVDLLKCDYELVDGQVLRQALGLPAFYDNTIRKASDFDTIVLILETHAILLSVNIDTDEVIVDLRESTDREALIAGTQDWLERDSGDWVDIAPLQDKIGSCLGWLWCARNYRGYSDMIALSFAGIEPEIAIVGIASSLRLYPVGRIVE